MKLPIEIFPRAVVIRDLSSSECGACKAATVRHDVDDEAVVRVQILNMGSESCNDNRGYQENVGVS